MTEPIQVQTASARHLSGLIELLVKAVALGVPVLYAAGRLYTDAYWQQLGIAASLMDNAAEDYLYYGFTATVLALARLVGLDPYATIGRILLVAGAIGLFLLVVFVLGRVVRPWIQKQANKADHFLQEFKTLVRHELAQKLLGIVSFALGIAFVLLSLVWVCLVLFLFIGLASREGKLQAEQIQERLHHPTSKASRERPPLPLATFIREDKTFTVPLLECSLNWCVVYADQRITAIPAQTMQAVVPRAALMLPVKP